MRTRNLIWFLLGLLALLLVRRYLDAVEVRGSSMAPALLPGDRLLAARLRPRTGDVVLARDPREPRRELIKRAARVDRRGVVLRGDNSAASTDASTFGTVPVTAVNWRILLRYWPPERAGRVPLPPISEGGEPACTFPEALIAR
jgi:nickel-type superoxide dismutase maturation protease